MSRAVSPYRLDLDPWIIAVAVIRCGLIMAARGCLADQLNWILVLPRKWSRPHRGWYLSIRAALYGSRAELIAFIASVAWTFSKAGVDLQLIISRITALGVFGLLTLLFIPKLNRGGPQRRT